MSEDKIYPTMVIRSQAEAIELLEKENKQLKKENEELKQLLEDDITRRCEIKEVCEERWGELNEW